jgi:hypothetical protein
MCGAARGPLRLGQHGDVHAHTLARTDPPGLRTHSTKIAVSMISIVRTRRSAL